MKKRLLSSLLTVMILLSSLTCLFTIEVSATGIDNIIARANYMYNITWVSQKTVYGWRNNYVYYAGQTYRMPYGQPVYSGKYIGYGVSVDDFIAATKDASSIFYTAKSEYAGKTSTYYASDCSSFVSYAWGLSRQTTSSIQSFSYTYGYCNASNIDKLQLGDALNLSGSHVVLVTGLTYDANGAISTIEITEQTPPQLKRTLHSRASLANSYSSYTICRYKNRDNVPAAPNAPAVVNNPIASLDGLQGGTGTVSVSGWCYDADNLNKSLDVEVYIGGEKGSATAERHVVKADAYRGDVHTLFKCGEYHGLSSVIATNKVGKQPVYVYAVNIGSGTDQLMGGNVVTIAANPNAGNSFEYNGNRYTYYNTEYLSWDEAQAFCKEKGGHLATFTTEDEWNNVSANLLLPKNYPNVWFGGYYPLPGSGEKEARTWVTGEEWTDWGDMFYDVEDDNYYMGTWNNGSRYGWSYYKNVSPSIQGFICEEDCPLKLAETECNNSIYTYYDISGLRFQTWEQAKEFCEAKGGHLATFTTEDEWNYVSENLLKNQNSPNAWFGGYYPLPGSGEEAARTWVTGEKWTDWGDMLYNIDDNSYYMGTLNDGSRYGWSYFTNDSAAVKGIICENEKPAKVSEVEYNHNTYAYYDISGCRYRTWEEAEEFCKSIGGHLATFTTADEWNYVNENLLKPQNSPNAWFGGYYPLPNSGEEEARTWATGEQWSDWGDMFYDVEDNCYYMGTWNNGTRYGWSYYVNNSGSIKGIICEKDNPYEVKRTEYKGNTYVYIDASKLRHMSWTEAEAYCQAMGGHLATITTDNEWAAVNDNLLKPLNNPNVWLGGNLTGDTLEWVTEEKYKVLGNVEFVDLTDGCNYLGTWTTESGVYGLSYYGENSKSIEGFICEIESDVLMGDVNGDGIVSINDVTDIQKHIAELITLTDEQLAVADVNDSGDVDITDATRLQLIIAEIISYR